MNRRITDKARRVSDKLVADRETLKRRLRKLNYDELSGFSVDQLQNIVLGLFGRRSPEYQSSKECISSYALAHIICDECEMGYPGKFDMQSTIKMIENKINEKLKIGV